jgi:hypothetical protein
MGQCSRQLLLVIPHGSRSPVVELPTTREREGTSYYLGNCCPRSRLELRRNNKRDRVDGCPMRVCEQLSVVLVAQWARTLARGQGERGGEGGGERARP